MPCSLCTTGSPSFSSARSRTIESTAVACSCLRRPARRAVPAYSSASVTKASCPCGRALGSAKPLCSGATAIEKCASPARNAAKSSTGCGRRPLSANSCSSVSRRPAESAHISTRVCLSSSSASRLTSGSSARRLTETSGRIAENGVWSAPGSVCSTRRAIGLAPTKNCSSDRNRSAGGSSGRSRSCRMKL
ncbi:hypothetical protein D9M69_480510 [compost metagenome]